MRKPLQQKLQMEITFKYKTNKETNKQHQKQFRKISPNQTTPIRIWLDMHVYIMCQLSGEREEVRKGRGSSSSGGGGEEPRARSVSGFSTDQCHVWSLMKWNSNEKIRSKEPQKPKFRLLAQRSNFAMDIRIWYNVQRFANNKNIPTYSHHRHCIIA